MVWPNHGRRPRFGQEANGGMSKNPFVSAVGPGKYRQARPNDQRTRRFAAYLLTLGYGQWWPNAASQTPNT